MTYCLFHEGVEIMRGFDSREVARIGAKAWLSVEPLKRRVVQIAYINGPGVVDVNVVEDVIAPEWKAEVKRTCAALRPVLSKEKFLAGRTIGKKKSVLAYYWPQFVAGPVPCRMTAVGDWSDPKSLAVGFVTARRGGWHRNTRLEGRLGDFLPRNALRKSRQHPGKWYIAAHMWPQSKKEEVT